jgi:hypothetical protein
MLDSERVTEIGRKEWEVLRQGDSWGGGERRWGRERGGGGGEDREKGRDREIILNFHWLAIIVFRCMLQYGLATKRDFNAPSWKRIGVRKFSS